MAQPASKRLVTEANITDPNSVAGAVVVATANSAVNAVVDGKVDAAVAGQMSEINTQVEAAQSAAVDAGAAKALADQAVIDARGYAEEGAFLLDQRGSVSGTLDLSGVTTKNIVHARLTGNLKVVLPSSPVVGQTITLELQQDATGGRTLTLPNAVASFGVPITLSTAANALDEIMCLYDGVRWKARVGGLSDSIPTSWVV